MLSTMTYFKHQVKEFLLTLAKIKRMTSIIRLMPSIKWTERYEFQVHTTFTSLDIKVMIYSYII